MTIEQQDAKPELNRQQMIEELRATIHDFFIEDDEDSDADDSYNWDQGKPYWDSIGDTLSGYSDARIKTLHADLAGRTRMTKAQHVTARMVFDSKNESFMMAFDVLGPQFNVTDKTSSVRALLEGLKLSDHKLGGYLNQFETYGSMLGPRILTVLNAVCSVQNRYPGESYRSESTMLLGYVPNRAYPFIKDRAVLSMLLERPQDADRIIDISMERGSITTYQMVQILDSKAPALSDGVL